MRKEAFNFITELIRKGRPGTKITRAQVTRHMLKLYNPGKKDGAQGSCRTTGDAIFAFYMQKGILERIGRGVYEIIKLPLVFMVYEEIRKELR